MGQGWSQEYSGPVATTSAGLGPKYRADSEPPTSAHYGGTKLDSNIPEDEELQTTPTSIAQLTNPIASADWKQASSESGILKEKSAALAAILDAKATQPPSGTLQKSSSQGENLCPPKPQLDRSQSLYYSPFADFSLFPDKFGPYKTRQLSGSDEEKSIPPTPPPTPLISMASALFRPRASTHSPSLAPEAPDQAKDDANEQIRPRSSSCGPAKKYERHKGVHGGRRFSLFPVYDTTTNTSQSTTQTEKENNIQDNSQTNETELLPKKIPPEFSAVQDHYHTWSHQNIGQRPTVIITEDKANYVNSAALIASTLALEASKPPINNNTPKKSPPPRFSFFDYSMIPDKDPRAFVQSKQKVQAPPKEISSSDSKRK